MTKIISFTNLEKEFSPEFRQLIGNAEDISDLENHFSLTLTKFVEKALDNGTKININDIFFNPEKKHYYQISNNLKSKDNFLYLIENSDIKRIMRDFAETAHNRFLHLKKDHKKTNAKIRN